MSGARAEHDSRQVPVALDATALPVVQHLDAVDHTIVVEPGQHFAARRDGQIVDRRPVHVEAPHLPDVLPSPAPVVVGNAGPQDGGVVAGAGHVVERIFEIPAREPAATMLRIGRNSADGANEERGVIPTSFGAVDVHAAHDAPAVPDVAEKLGVRFVVEMRIVATHTRTAALVGAKDVVDEVEEFSELPRRGPSRPFVLR